VDQVLLRERINEAAGFIKGRAGGEGLPRTVEPEAGVILGSGLGPLAEEVENPLVIPYGEIPHFPVSTVVGHAGRLLIGRLAGRQVAVMQGRFHYYEGYSLDEVTFPVRVMKALGIRALIVTNASGGINPEFEAGDLMLITDHINLVGDNPLRGPNDADLGPRFPDLSEAYDPVLRAAAHRVAQAEGLILRDGVYVALSGPTYETPAEVSFVRSIGGDAVGMSTVPEAIVARHAGLRLCGVSCVTNVHRPKGDPRRREVSHREVIEVANRAGSDLSRLIQGLLRADWEERG
jgi:purine-nucleoside phosphorylase